MVNNRIEFKEEKYAEFLRRKADVSKQKKIRNDETLSTLKDILELKLKDLDSKRIELRRIR